MHATDRVVIVASGFGIWQGGRHAASARWMDVAGVRVLERDEPATSPAVIALRLRDGTEVLLHEEVPGFESFLAAAERSLPGMVVRSVWRSKVSNPAFTRNETVLFERGTRKG